MLTAETLPRTRGFDSPVRDRPDLQDEYILDSNDTECPGAAQAPSADIVREIAEIADSIDNWRLFVSVCDYDYDIGKMWNTMWAQLNIAGLKSQELEGCVEKLQVFRSYLSADLEQELGDLYISQGENYRTRCFADNLRVAVLEPLDALISYLNNFMNQGGPFKALNELNPNTWFSSKSYNQIVSEVIDAVALEVEGRSDVEGASSTRSIQAA